MGTWAKLRMAGYLGLAMGMGYWTASRITLPNDTLLADTSPSGITASTGHVAVYGNCDEARAAGVAPIYRDEPGYESRLDADHDGIACEPYYGPVKNFGRRTSERRKSRYAASP